MRRVYFRARTGLIETQRADNLRPRAPIRARKTVQEAEIVIDGIIGADIFGDGVSAGQVRADLKRAGGAQRVRVLMNSPGGDVFEGLAIFNTLRRASPEITVEVEGLAASAASLVAMAADRLLMRKNAFMMIHKPWGGTLGDAEEMRKAAFMLDKIEATMVDTYAERTGLDEGELGDMLAAETWMNAGEAVEMGFADAVADEEAVVSARAAPFLAQYRNLPEKLRAASRREQVDARAFRRLMDAADKVLEG